MTQQFSRPRWSEPQPEVIPLARPNLEQELATVKRQYQDLQTRHAQLAATLAQLSKQYGATQPLPTAIAPSPTAASQPSRSLPIPPQLSSSMPQQAPATPHSDLSFLSNLRQQRPAPATPVAPPPQAAPPQWQPAAPQLRPIQQPAQQPPAVQPQPQWQPQHEAQQPPTWQQHHSEPQQPWRQDPSEAAQQYDSLYEKVRHQQDDQATPMWMWVVAALLLLTVSFGTGFLLVRHFVGRPAPPPTVENAN